MLSNIQISLAICTNLMQQSQIKKTFAQCIFRPKRISENRLLLFATRRSPISSLFVKVRRIFPASARCSHHTRKLVTSLEEEAEDLASQMLPAGLLVIHDATAGGQHDVTAHGQNKTRDGIRIVFFGAGHWLFVFVVGTQTHTNTLTRTDATAADCWSTSRCR